MHKKSHKAGAGYGSPKKMSSNSGGPHPVKEAEGMKLNGALVGQRKTYRITGKTHNPYSGY